MRTNKNIIQLFSVITFLCVIPFIFWGQESKNAGRSLTAFDHLIPPETFLVIYFNDIDNLEKKIQQTAIGAYLRDPNSQPWREAVLQQWKTVTEKLFDPIPVFKNCEAGAFIVLFSTSVEKSKPVLSSALLFKFQPQTQQIITQYIQSLIQDFSKRHSPAFSVVEKRVKDFHTMAFKYREQKRAFLALSAEYGIFTFNENLFVRLLQLDKPNQNLQDVQQRAILAEEDFFVWLNLAEFLSSIMENPKLSASQFQQLQLILELSGIKQTKYMYLGERFQHNEIKTRFGLVFEGERSGIFALAKPTGRLSILNAVNFPEYYCGAISIIAPAENLRRARELARAVSGEQASQQIDMLLAMVQLLTGINLEQDVLALFGTQYAYVTKSIFEGALVIELTNQQKFDQLINNLCLRFRLKRIDYSYNNLQYFQLVSTDSRIPLFFARSSRYMVISSSHSLMRQVLAKTTQAEKMAATPADETDTGSLVAQFYSPPSDLSLITALCDLFVSNLNKTTPQIKKIGGINPLLVPDFTIMMDHAFPSQTIVVAEKDNLEMQTRSAFGMSSTALVLFPVFETLISLMPRDFLSAIDYEHARICRENLLKIDSAKEQWALEKNLSNGTPLPEDWLDNPAIVSEQGYLKKKPVCPAGGTYRINPIGTDPECSIGTALSPSNTDLWHKLSPGK